MIGRIASSPKQAVSLPFRNIVTKPSLTQWRGGLVSDVYAHLAALTRLVTSLLMDTSVHARSLSKDSICLQGTDRGKRRAACLPAWHRSCQEEFCVYPVARVSEELAQLLANVHCVLARCSRKQNGVWIWTQSLPPSVIYTTSEAALGVKDIMDTISF